MSLTETPGLLTAGSGSLTASSGRLTANSGPLTTSRISVFFRVMGYFAMFYRDDGNGKAKIGGQVKRVNTKKVVLVRVWP